MINNKSVDSTDEERVLARNPILFAIRGPLTGRTFSLGEPLVSIGREMSNDIVVDDPTVSRHHCAIRSEGQQHTIEDLSSSNGTYVNGERVQVASLKEEFLIEIGASRFLVRLRTSEELTASGQNFLVAEYVSNNYDAFYGRD